jgi:hypothetical protein
MAQLCRTSTHTVDHVRRGLYRLVVFGQCPNPNGYNLVVWVHGNKRKAFARLDQLLALPPSFRASGRPLPAFPSGTVREAATAYRTGPAHLPLGRLVATPGALDVARAHGVDVLALVRRHAAGDWGTVPAEDARANERALAAGARVLSAYDTAGGRLWIITEADRSATTVLLPSEY